MWDVKNDNSLGVLVEAVTDAPVATAAGRVLPVVLIAKRMPDAKRVIQQRPGDELGHRRRYLFR